MTHRERFEKTMNHQAPDRVPIDLDGTCLTSLHEEVLGRFLKLHGLQAEDPEQAKEELLSLYDIDFRRVGGILEPRSPLQDYSHRGEGWYRDCWGVRRKFTGVYWDIVECPLADATLEEVKAFPWPDAADLDRKQLSVWAEKAKRLYYDSGYVVAGEHPVFGYLELGCWMFGFDDFLYRLLAEPEVTDWFFGRYHRFVEDVCELYYGALGPYLHVTTSGDDFGTQNGPFLSPELFEERIAPWYRKRISLTKSLSPARYFHHSCGSVFRLLPSLIGMGAEILNPIQPGAFEMEPERLKAAFGREIVFWGGIDEQQLLSHGTPDQVREEVRRVAGILGKDGGYVMAASHNIQPDVPVENIHAMLTALTER